MARKAKPGSKRASSSSRKKAAAPKIKKVNPVPEGMHTVTPHIVVRDAAGAIEFYKQAFGAKELHRMMMPDGKTVMHAAIRVGDSMIMMADELPNMGTRSPATIGGTPVSFYLYVKDVDKFFDKAVRAGAKVTMPIMDAFWGDRMGALEDPYGHSWSIASRKKILSPKQMKQAQEEWMASMAATAGKPEQQEQQQAPPQA
jgi:uncharacterized glyoxalase superfamily protein PhnB